MQLSRIISVEHAIGWEDTQSDSAKERRHLSQGHVLFEPPLASPFVGELAKDPRPGCCLADPDSGSPRTTQTWECTVVAASATHPPGCLWTSQSWWPWSTNSTQRPWTSLKPGTSSGKPEAATTVAATLKVCFCWLFLLERDLVFSHCFKRDKEISVRLLGAIVWVAHT